MRWALVLLYLLAVGDQALSCAIIYALIPPSSVNISAPHTVSALTNSFQLLYLHQRASPSLIGHKTTNFSSNLIINTASGGDYDFQVRLINAAVATRVRRFIPHEFEHDSLNERVQERSVSSAERANEDHDTNFERVGIGVGCILDTRLTSGDLDFDMQWQSATIHDTGNTRFPASSFERVGRNQFLYAAGVLTSAYERSTGSEWSATARIARGFPDVGMFLMERSILYDEGVESSRRLPASQTVEGIASTTYHGFKHRGKGHCGCG
ncbi:hypothetical protein K469DRAFT_739940 [Zopfia rhizophila CBS 207.26]|uniref:Uncharacterized protein n=1 Tax=Zopfia rhizophila CBS 207.26 TaxID=1314779 RepID=A0A6A6DTV3_9PEZI|nr:hypothetical protein K469DRAFT_739940 [Zopfia rhizophila CBS 207.26]